MTDDSNLKILRRSNLSGQIAVLLGTRPGIVKMSPLVRGLAAAGADFFVIHSGQHYSPDMDRQFFVDLNLPEPRHRLEGMSAYRLHGEQTAEMLKGIERVLVQERPWVLLVGGDANTNLAGALAARKLHLRVGHVEAGLRSYDWRMPEEHNRVMIDHISDYLFAPGENARANLEREQVLGSVYVVGNTIVDAALGNYQIAQERSRILETAGLRPGEYLLATSHREENVDFYESLKGIVAGLKRVVKETELPVAFPVHRRTQDRLKSFGLLAELESEQGIKLLPPAGFLDFLRLLGNAGAVLTDSGGVQQEACILRVPCVTLRDNTEWVETQQLGCNVLAGANSDAIARLTRQQLGLARDWPNPFGDGTAAQRIIDIVQRQRDNHADPALR